GPACLDELACRDHSGVAKDGDQVALAPGLHWQYAKAVLRVVESHAVDEPGKDLGWRARPGCLRHQGMMETTSHLVAIYELRQHGNLSISSDRAKPDVQLYRGTNTEQCHFRKSLLESSLDYITDT